MGYYTDYEIKVERKDGLPLDPDVYAEIKEALEDGSYYRFDLDLKMWEAKWYEHDDTMRGVSARFPELLFTLMGEGEESGDIWKAYYYQGRGVRYNATISFPDFLVGDLQ